MKSVPVIRGVGEVMEEYRDYMLTQRPEPARGEPVDCDTRSRVSSLARSVPYLWYVFAYSQYGSVQATREGEFLMVDPTNGALDLKLISERYFAAWEANDPDAIVALH